MKKINKICPPQYFVALAEENPECGWAATRQVSYMLRNYILQNEQHGRCAYTEMRISPHSSCSHIDHFRKRSLYRDMTFDYNNLMVSCNSEFFSAKYKDKHIQPEDYEFLINPVEEDPQDYLQYSFTGKVLPKQRSLKAIKTIALLNLNHPALVERRKQIAFMLTNPRYRNMSEHKVLRIIGEMDTFIIAIRHKIRYDKDVRYLDRVRLG